MIQFLYLNFSKYSIDKYKINYINATKERKIVSSQRIVDIFGSPFRYRLLIKLGLY